MQGNKELFVQRNNLAKTGIVYCTLWRDRATKRLVSPPRITSYGLMFRKGLDVDSCMNDAVEMVEDLCADAKRQDDLEDLLRLELRRFFRKRASHKPVAIPLVLDV